MSFVLHTARPSDGNAGIVLVEAAPGQGETLAAATAGTPWRFEVEKKSGKVETLAFANFSRALQLVPSRGRTGGCLFVSNFQQCSDVRSGGKTFFYC
jgi:phosphoglucan,water dikinase